MREDYTRKGLPPPAEDTARSQYLDKGVPAPDLVTVKDFLRFYVATSHPQIDKYKPTADAICTVGEWFFAGFTRVTGHLSLLMLPSSRRGARWSGAARLSRYSTNSEQSQS